MDPINENEQQAENENKRAENNNIRNDKEPAEEEKDEVLIDTNDNNTLSSLESNDSESNDNKSKDPSGSLSSQERLDQAAAARLDAAAQRLSQGSNGGRNKSTQVSDHTTHIGRHTDTNSNSGRSRDPTGHRASKSSSKSRDGSKRSSRSSATNERRFQGIESNIVRINQALQVISEAVGAKIPGPTQEALPSTSIRDAVAVDLAPVKITAQGTRLTTAPVLFRQNDSAFWQYSGDMMKHVTVMKCDPPNANRRMPVYTVICNDGGQENIVLHDQLFISESEDTATQWDREDRITSDMNLLSATDRMDLYAMGPSPYTTAQATQWANMDGSKFKLATLQTALKDITLDSDSLVELKRLHAILSAGITGASTTGLLALPKLSELSPTISIRTVWLPPARHPQFPTAMACYQNIANVISTTLTNKEFAKKAPKARFAISTVAKTLDGIDMLDHLYKSRIPMLGATDFNPYVEIMTLKAEHKCSPLLSSPRLKTFKLSWFSLHILRRTTLFSSSFSKSS
jgi:hypothetical protein